MFFSNENTNAVTEQDISLTYEVCAVLQTLRVVRRNIANTTEERMPIMDCHSISRLLALIFKELTLEDGTLIGLDHTLVEGKVAMVHTDHSWLRTPDRAIIDPYPMGIISPTLALLIPTSKTRYRVHGGNHYHENPSVRERFDVEQSLKNAHSCRLLLSKYSRLEDVSEILANMMR